MPEYGLYWHIPAIRFGKRVMRNYNTLIDRYPGADGMKTGFICASGFNLVATATRGSRRLIAVVLGSRSGMQRAEKAAQLLERGFTGGNGLSWLIPAFGTVESLQPVDAAPLNLRDEICNAKVRRRPPSDSEAVAAQTEEAGSSLAMMAGFQLGPPKPGSLIGPLQPSMAPIPVFVGTKPPANIDVASEPAAGKKPARKTAAHGPAGALTEKPAQARSAAGAPPSKPTPAASEKPAPAKPSPTAVKPNRPAMQPQATPKPQAVPKPQATPKPQVAPKPQATAKPLVPAKPTTAVIAEPTAKPKPKPKPKPVAATQ
jgi:D-alanyl-D-alanine carboxypeptidase